MRLRICYIAGREAEYSRTRTVMAGLLYAGFEVIPCFPATKSFKHYPRLIWKFIKYQQSCDLILVGFYGQLLLPVVRLLTKKPPLTPSAIAGVTQNANLDRSSAFADLGYDPVGVREGFRKCFGSSQSP